jgi:hypothetical protein
MAESMDTHHPSQPPSAATIEAGQQALERGAWAEARSAFARAEIQRAGGKCRDLVWPGRGAVVAW